MKRAPWLSLAPRQRDALAAGSQSREESWSMRHPGSDAFVDETPFAEPIKPEIGGKRPRLPRRDQLGHRPARARDRLEPARSPATVDEAVAERRPGQDG